MKISFGPNHGDNICGKAGDLHFVNFKTICHNPLLEGLASVAPVLHPVTFLLLGFIPVIKSIVRKAGAVTGIRTREDGADTERTGPSGSKADVHRRPLNDVFLVHLQSQLHNGVSTRLENNPAMIVSCGRLWYQNTSASSKKEREAAATQKQPECHQCRQHICRRRKAIWPRSRVLLGGKRLFEFVFARCPVNIVGSPLHTPENGLAGTVLVVALSRFNMSAHCEHNLAPDSSASSLASLPRPVTA